MSIRKIVILFLSIFNLLVLYNLNESSVAYAERVYCSTINNTDYYIDTSTISGTASGLTYVDVYSSNGKSYLWCFDNFNDEWLYNYSESLSPSGLGKFRKVSESKLANDILYVTLRYRSW